MDILTKICHTYVYLQDNNVQSCIGLLELRSQPNNTSLVGTTGILFQPPAHSDCSTSPRDTCTGLETWFQVDNNVQQNKKAEVFGYPQFLSEQKLHSQQ